MNKFALIIMLLCGCFIISQFEPLQAQEKKGKLGDFEDANKGKKSDDDDDDDDEGGGWFSFFFDIGLDLILAEPEEDTQNNLLEETTFGEYPFATGGVIDQDGTGKSYLGRLSGGYQEIDSRTKGYRFNARFQFAGVHGLTVDFTDYTENLKSSTDHLQVIGLSYRRLLVANNTLLMAGNVGLKVINPDKLKDADYGLDFALDAQWFFTRPLSLNGKFAVAPIIDQLDADAWPILFDLELGLGWHIRNIELFASYKTMIPSVDPDEALYGPELGIRFWF